MRIDNPACYECPKGENNLHTWKRNEAGTLAFCVKCGLELNEADTADCFYEHDPRMKLTLKDMHKLHDYPKVLPPMTKEGEKM